jgi:hypothetical protein
MQELIEVLSEVTIPIEEIIASGGGEAKGTRRLRRALVEKGWTKGRFKIVKSINDVQKESTTHEIDHVRQTPDGSTLALEIEWNNKDPFFDRDLENFKRLHTEGAISAGILVTRGTSLQDNLKALGACPSSLWIFRCESDSVQGHEQAFSPLEDRRGAASAAERAGLCG